MDFILKMMDFTLTMMDFILKMMDFTLTMMDFILKMMNSAGHCPRRGDLHYDQEEEYRGGQFIDNCLLKYLIYHWKWWFSIKTWCFPTEQWWFPIEKRWFSVEHGDFLLKNGVEFIMIKTGRFDKILSAVGIRRGAGGMYYSRRLAWNICKNIKEYKRIQNWNTRINV